MHRLRLCQTRVYAPQILEHWLHTQQKTRHPLEFLLVRGPKHVHWLSSHNLAPQLPGSSSQAIKRPAHKPGVYHVLQKRKLLPLRTHPDFHSQEDRERIYPSNELIQTLHAQAGAQVHLRFRAVHPWWQKWQQLKARWRGASPACLDRLNQPLFKAKIQCTHKFPNYFHGFNQPQFGELKMVKRPWTLKRYPLLLTARELASLFAFPHPQHCAPYLDTEPTAYFPAPKAEPLHLQPEDRKRHLYILGKTGMGKSSTLLYLLHKQWTEPGTHILMDPHGDLLEDATQYTPKNRLKDLIFLDPSATHYPLALNPVESKHTPAHLQASALIEMFFALSKGSWGPRLEHILRNALLTLIQLPNTSLLDLPDLLNEPKQFKKKFHHLKEANLHNFWKHEFPKDPRLRSEYISPILNKVGPLLSSPISRNIFAQNRSKIHFDTLLSQSKIILINLAKGQLGEDVSRMLGMVFISMIQAALLRRARLPPHERNTVQLTLDEFQNFATPTLLSMLAESRKYGLGLTLANQYLTQLPPELQDAVLGNAGSLLSFRTSPADAQHLAPFLGLSPEDLSQLAPFQAYAKVLHHNQPLPLFRWTVPKPHAKQASHQAKIDQRYQLCLQRYGRQRQKVESLQKGRIMSAINSRHETPPP